MAHQSPLPCVFVDMVFVIFYKGLHMTTKQWMLGLALAGAMIVGCEDKSPKPAAPSSSGVSSSLEDAKKAAGDTAKKVEEGAKDAYKKTEEVAKDTYEKSKEVAKDATHATGEAVEKAGEKIQEGGEALKEMGK